MKLSKSAGNNDGGQVVEKSFLAFQDVFWKFSSRCLPLVDSGQIQRKSKIQFLGALPFRALSQ